MMLVEGEERLQQRAWLVLLTALGAWLGAGLVMAVPPLAARPAVAAMGVAEEALRGRWFSWYVTAFLLGAATGGLLFGWLGDRVGRARSLGLAVLTYSLLAATCYWVSNPWQLLVGWFLACTGVGGVWPNGVSLVAEALPRFSRPWISGLFGCVANLGLMLMALLAWYFPITPESWRWVMLAAAAPGWLGLVILWSVPESRAWQASRARLGQSSAAGPLAELFRPPLRRLTLIGIVLGTIPMMGNWGAINWLVPWAYQVQEGTSGQGLSASTQWMKSSGALLGSLVGGALASRCGRRTAYFIISLLSLITSFYIYGWLTPLAPSFLMWVFVQGFFCTLYFGWLPLYLPELFPTRVRATGTGVAFNWGRLATAVGVLLGGQLILHFDGDYARVGQWTCLIYALGLFVILAAPDTTSPNHQSTLGR
jgi:SHS family sialic acid transporter-like MFS transporter